MTKYDKELIFSLIDNLKGVKIEKNTEDKLNKIELDILEFIEKNNQNEDLKNKSSKKKVRRNYDNKMWNRNKLDDKHSEKDIIPNTIIKNNTKTEKESLLDSIKILINKISHNNYTKISNQIIEIYKKIIFKYHNENDIIKEFNDFIINNIIFNNKLFIPLYSNVYKELSIINKDISESFLKKLDMFNDMENKLIYHSLENNDNIVINKNNDKLKSLCIFIINIAKLNLIDNDIIINKTTNLLKFINIQFNVTSNISFCEELTELLFVIVDEICNNISFYKKLNIEEIKKNVLVISNLKKNDKISISNKIIFKFMDIRDKFNKLDSSLIQK